MGGGAPVSKTALLKAGLVKTALNARFTEAEASDAVANATPAAMIAGRGFTQRDRGTPGFESVRQFIALEGAPGMLGYEDLLAPASASPPPVTVSARDLAVLHFSSGSTGKIKAAMQSYGKRLACLRKMLEEHAMTPLKQPHGPVILSTVNKHLATFQEIPAAGADAIAVKVSQAGARARTRLWLALLHIDRP